MSGVPVFPQPSPDEIRERLKAGGFSLKDHIEGMEWEFIVMALKLTSGNRSRASELLGLKRTTLVEKMRKRGWITNKNKKRDPGLPWWR